MRSEVTLLIHDESGTARPVAVCSSRFIIGRDTDSDLVLSDPGVARRHAVIESLDGVVELTSYNSQGATQVNGVAISRPTRLRDGDLITLGGVRDIEVRMPAAATALYQTRSATADARAPAAPGRTVRARGARRAERNREGDGRGAPAASGARNSPLLALSVAASLLLIGGVSLFLLKRRQPVPSDPLPSRSTARPGQTSVPGARAGGGAPGAADAAGGGAQEAAASQPAAHGNDVSHAVRAEQVERTAKQLMRRISSDGNSSSFPPAALADITKKVEEYRGSAPALRAAFVSVQRGGEGLARLARDEGVEPDLVIYTALAQVDGGRVAAQDPLAAGRAALPQLADLRKKLGGGTAESSLIIVAAYREGVGTKKSHPLVGRLRSIERAFEQRNVWHLRATRAIHEDAYDFVLRFLALGAIAQDPREHGIDADPLLF